MKLPVLPLQSVSTKSSAFWREKWDEVACQEHNNTASTRLKPEIVATTKQGSYPLDHVSSNTGKSRFLKNQLRTSEQHSKQGTLS